MSKYSSHRYILFILFSFFISCLPLFSLLSPGLPLTHDGEDHVGRIANFYQSLSEGNIIPRWAGNLNWGYGHPILMFLYPLPSYLASFFHFLGFSFIDSVKIVFGLGFLASGFTMWLWVRSFLGIEAGVFAAILYMFAPYRFVDLYVRGALGEHIAFVFPPLILYFLLRLSKNNNDISSLLFGSISLALLILSHNAISLMFLPLIVLYMAFLVFCSQKKRSTTTSYILVFLFGFGLSAFFWVPGFFEGKYTHRDTITEKAYMESFSSFSRFISSPWSFEGTGKLSVEVGKIQWVVMLAGFPVTFFLFIKRKPLGILAIFALVAFWISLFLMTSLSLFFWQNIALIQKFQFPWRFLTLSVFSASLIGGIITSALPQKIRMGVIIIGIFAAMFFNKDYWRTNGSITQTDKFFSGVYFGTTDTGESSPIWAVSYMWQMPKVHLDVIGGTAHVKELERLSTKHIYEVSADTKSQFRENTLYFPGWSVTADGKNLPIEFQARNNMGVMTFFLAKGKHIVTIQFAETRLRQLASFVSLLTIIGIVFLVVKFHCPIFLEILRYQHQ